MAFSGVVLLATLAWHLFAPMPTGLEPTVVDKVDRCIDATSASSVSRPALDELLSRSVEPPNACWHATRLPDMVSAEIIAQPGGEHGLWRVRFREQLRVSKQWPPGEPLIIQAPRVMGSAWQMRIAGTVVADNLVDWRMTSNRPMEVRLDANRFVPGGVLDVEIRLAYVGTHGYAMPRITVGPYTALVTSNWWRHYLQITFPQAASAAMLLLGAFFISLWSARRADHAYLWLAWASLVWSISNLQYALPHPDDATRDAWYVAIVQLMPLPWLTWLIFSFVATFADRRVHWLEQLLPVYVLVISLVSLPIWSTQRESALLIVMVYTVVGTVTVGTICWLALVSRSTELRVISVVLALSCVAATNDLALAAHWVNPERLFLVPYIGLMLFTSFLFALQRRYARAITDHELLSAELSTRLQRREQELLLQHQRVLELEREQTLSVERQRLMREMHDGIGSSLTASLAAFEQGDICESDIEQMLRDCLDDLHAVIDSLEPTDKDIVGQLAMLRYRLGRRLDAVGIHVEWLMRELPPLDWMGPTEALHILRIVQEVLANVLKHATASCVRVQVAHSDGQVDLCVQDNGRGFDMSKTIHGRGLKFLYNRAAALGAELSVQSSPGHGTTVRLLLPVERAGQSPGNPH